MSPAIEIRAVFLVFCCNAIAETKYVLGNILHWRDALSFWGWEVTFRAATRAGLDLVRPLTTTEPLEAVHQMVRAAGVKSWEGDRFMAPDIEAVAELVRNGSIAQILKDAL